MFRSYNLNYRLTLGLTNTLVAECTFIHGNFLGSDVGNEDTMFSLPLSTVWNRNRVTDLSAGIMAFNFGNLMTLDIRNINALLLSHGATFSGRSLLAVSSGNISALLLFNSITYGLGNISTVFLGKLTTLLLGDVMTFLLRDIMTLLFISNLLAFLLVDSLTFLLVTGITFLLISSIALTTELSLKVIYYNKIINL